MILDDGFDTDNVRIVSLRFPGLVGMSMAQIASLLEGVASHLGKYEEVGKVVPPEGKVVGGVLVDPSGDGYFPFSVMVGAITEEDDSLFEEVVTRAKGGDQGFARGGNL